MALLLAWTAATSPLTTSRRHSAAQRFPSRRNGTILGGSRCCGVSSPMPHNPDALRRRRCRLARALHSRRPRATPLRMGRLVADPQPAPGGRRPSDTRRLGAGRPPEPPGPRPSGLLAMLGRNDEAWPLAEARSDHLREVDGLPLGGRLIPRGDRDGRRRPHRACRHHRAARGPTTRHRKGGVRLVQAARSPATSATSAASKPRSRSSALRPSRPAPAPVQGRSPPPRR